jgi:hypothetical protein
MIWKSLMPIRQAIIILFIRFDNGQLFFLISLEKQFYVHQMFMCNKKLAEWRDNSEFDRKFTSYSVKDLYPEYIKSLKT